MGFYANAADGVLQLCSGSMPLRPAGRDATHGGKGVALGTEAGLRQEGQVSGCRGEGGRGGSCLEVPLFNPAMLASGNVTPSKKSHSELHDLRVHGNDGVTAG